MRLIDKRGVNYAVRLGWLRVGLLVSGRQRLPDPKCSAVVGSGRALDCRCHPQGVQSGLRFGRSGTARADTLPGQAERRLNGVR